MKKGLLKKAAAVCMVILLFLSMAMFCAAAADVPDDPAQGEVVSEVTPEPEVESVIEPEVEPEVESQPEEPLTEAPAEETYNVTPSYEAPEHLDDLPQVESYEIPFATEIVLPDVEVSDTTLIGGVIAWLSIALGVSVIVGVLVSRRTKGKNQR